MEKYLICLLCFGAFIQISCGDKAISGAEPPQNEVICNLEDEESFDHVHIHTAHVGRNGGEFILKIVRYGDDDASYFGGCSVNTGEYHEIFKNDNYTDDYECQWFSIIKISPHEFKLRIFPVGDEYKDKVRLDLWLDAKYASDGKIYYRNVGAHFFEIY